MPTYTYTGKVTFVNSDYGIRADEGDEIESEFFLPTSWTDFTLTDANDPVAITPKSVTYTLTQGVPQTISIRGYSSLSFVLVAPGTSVVTIKFFNSGQTSFVTLNSDNPTFSTTINSYVASDNMIVEATTGNPKVIVNFKFEE